MLYFFFLFHFELKRQINVLHSTLPLFPRKSLHDFRPKCKKFVPVFRPKRCKIQYPLGRHIPIWLNEGSGVKKGKALARRKGHFMPGFVNLLYVEPKLTTQMLQGKYPTSQKSHRICMVHSIYLRCFNNKCNNH